LGNLTVTGEKGEPEVTQVFRIARSDSRSELVVASTADGS
jgi:hypothetical protein